MRYCDGWVWWFMLGVSLGIVWGVMLIEATCLGPGDVVGAEKIST
jgi:hypothetical protein